MCNCGTTAGWVLPSKANRCDGGVPKCGSTGAACTDATKPTCVEPTSFATPTYISETATCQVIPLICNSTSTYIIMCNVTGISIKCVSLNIKSVMSMGPKVTEQNKVLASQALAIMMGLVLCVLLRIPSHILAVLH